MTQGGPAIPVIPSSVPPDGGPALRVTVVSDGRSTEGGPARPVVEVFDGRPTQGNTPLPIVVATGVQAGRPLAGTPIPVTVVSGYLGSAYGAKVRSIAPANLLAFWPMDEPSGSVAFDRSGNSRNGAYTGVTLGQAGIGDGRTAPSFDGATSFNNVFGASLAAAFSGAEGTFAIWAKVSAAGVWTDATIRRLMYVQADASNRAFLQRPASNNTIDCTLIAGGTNKTASFATGAPTGWFHLALTWSKSGDALKGYLNGVQQGATQTGLGTFVGTPQATVTTVGAGSTIPANVWSGLLAQAAVWTTPLTAAQVLALATV